MRDAILSALEAKYKQSGGHCGTYLQSLSKDTGIPIKELKQEINALYKENLVTVTDGIRGKLILLKKPKHIPDYFEIIKNKKSKRK